MKINILLSIACALGCIVSTATAQNYRLEPLISFGSHGDGSVRPGDYSFLTADGNRYQRGMAYNPATGHLLVVNRDSAQQGIFILDGITGDFWGNLDVSGFLPGGNDAFVINLIGVADDGAIYIGNLSSSSTPPAFRLYRWDDEAAPQTLAYAGDPGNDDTNSINRRWGDTMAVRGAGINTQILLGSRGTLASLLMPVDASLTTFTSTVIQASVPSGSLGYGIAFGPTNTFYGTAGAQSGGPLRLLQYAIGSSLTATASVLASFGATAVANALTPISVNSNATLLAGITMNPGPDVVRLYSIGDLTNAPVFLDRDSFLTDSDNAVFAGAVAFAPNRLYALDSDNGIMAFSIVEANEAIAPAVILQPVSRNVLIGSNVTFTVAADGTLPFTYQWLFNGTNALAAATNLSLTISNAQVGDTSNYSVIVSNAVGSVLSSNASLSVTAQPISTRFVYEPFDYQPGTMVAGQGGWLLNAGTSATSEAGNLPITGLVDATGNRIFWGAASMSLRLPLGTNITSGSTYYSFAMNVEGLGAGFSGNGVLAGFANATTTSFGTKVDIRNNSGTSFTLGTSKAGTGTQIFDTNNFPTGTNIFLVGRYTFNPGAGDDVAELWINPDPATFGAANPPPPNLITTGGTDLAQFDRFFFRAGSALTTPDKLMTDELRVGSAWADVTPSSVVAAPRLSIAFFGQSVVVRWVAAEGAFTLQSTDVLPAAEWRAVTEPVGDEMGTNVVIIPIDDAQQFFRLTN